MAYSLAHQHSAPGAGPHRPRTNSLAPSRLTAINVCPVPQAGLAPIATQPKWIVHATTTKWVSPMEQAELDARAQQGPVGNDASGAHGTDLASEKGVAGDADHEPELDLQLRVRIGLAESSGRLDLTDCRLTHLPHQVLELKGLEDLSLAGNCLTSLPEGVSSLTSLKRLGLAGNRLTKLPESIGCLTQLEGLWLHGNMLTSIPESISNLTQLKQLSLSGNQLTQLPDAWGGMTALDDLAVSGNQLKQLPASFGALPSLRKLSVNGNRLESLPDKLSGLTSLQELWLQGNKLRTLPDSLCELKVLKEMSLGDNALVTLPTHFSHLKSLEKLWLYGNQLSSLPSQFLSGLPQLSQCWLEGNPSLQGAPVAAMLQDIANAMQPAPPSEPGNNIQSSSPVDECSSSTQGNETDDNRWTLLHPHSLGGDAPAQPAQTSTAGGWWLKALGLDTQQIEGVDPKRMAALGTRVKVGEVLGTGPGYFKLACSLCRPASGSQSVLVVAFGSAPGTPNWGGLLGRLYRAAKNETEKSFDVLYVVDPSRQWYGACTQGDVDDASGPSVKYWYERLEQYTQRYNRVIMLGDSMGATAALMFAPLATHVMAFCPQVDLTTSCMRPGVSDAALEAAKQVVLEAVQRLPDSSSAGADKPPTQVVALSGTWQHDLDQVNALPATKVRHQVYSLESHRLALYLEKQGKLVPLVQETILTAIGLQGKKIVRTANIL